MDTTLIFLLAYFAFGLVFLIVELVSCCREMYSDDFILTNTKVTGGGDVCDGNGKDGGGCNGGSDDGGRRECDVGVGGLVVVVVVVAGENVVTAED
ncbi:unnamed protein product [Brassica oleracea]|uniref:Transmembrane protein n=1 Tax=Brassica cretica TaxID=69181 RepID=A0ABQ7D9L0_BRACR|nr:hypothetical protein DY000_02017481 [Brassica cretica]